MGAAARIETVIAIERHSSAPRFSNTGCRMNNAMLHQEANRSKLASESQNQS